MGLCDAILKVALRLVIVHAILALMHVCSVRSEASEAAGQDQRKAENEPYQANEQEDDDIFDDLEKTAATHLEKPHDTAFGQFWKSLVSEENLLFYKELYFSTRYSMELDQLEGRNSIGFILVKSVVGEEGAFGDLNVQLRLARYDDQFMLGEEMPREYTEGEDDWEVELHNAYLRVRALPPDLNLQMGHFYVPFGLQPYLDTHGYLLQSPAMEFIGLERDWGISAYGQYPELEYQVALTTGSGMELVNKGDNYVVAAKVSTPRIGENLNDWAGLSVAYGDVIDRSAAERSRRFDMMRFEDDIVEKWRVGVDAQKLFGPFRVRGEVAYGQDSSTEDVLGLFLECRYVLDAGNHWTAAVQSENLLQDLGRRSRAEDVTVRLGLQYSFSANYNVQLVWSHDFDLVVGERDDWFGILFYAVKGGGIFDW